jgi:hypothetical protein
VQTKKKPTFYWTESLLQNRQKISIEDFCSEFENVNDVNCFKKEDFTHLFS